MNEFCNHPCSECAAGCNCDCEPCVLADRYRLEDRVRELERELAVTKSALVSTRIQVEHYQATVKELCRSGYNVETQERGLRDMAGVDIKL